MSEKKHRYATGMCRHKSRIAAEFAVRAIGLAVSDSTDLRDLGLRSASCLCPQVGQRGDLGGCRWGCFSHFIGDSQVPSGRCFYLIDSDSRVQVSQNKFLGHWIRAKHTEIGDDLSRALTP